MLDFHYKILIYSVNENCRFLILSKCSNVELKDKNWSQYVMIDQGQQVFYRKKTFVDFTEWLTSRLNTIRRSEKCIILERFSHKWKWEVRSVSSWNDFHTTISGAKSLPIVGQSLRPGINGHDKVLPEMVFIFLCCKLEQIWDHY